MGRLTVYAQNNPWQYAVRLTLIAAALGPTPLLLVLADLARGPGPGVPVLFAGIVVGLALGLVLLVPLLAWMLRRMVKGNPVPPDSDPARVWAAHWQIMKGTLHEDPETNRLGRILADQSDTSRSPKFFAALCGILVLLNGGNLALQYAAGSSTAAWLPVVPLLFLVAAFPLIRRRQRRVREFRDLYDRTASSPHPLG
ncbi:hypothetical protein FZ103_04340 [Streptomonospora sp. PA3]|nr:hypothetical protein [Streptomonospora sp. PA3]